MAHAALQRVEEEEKNDIPILHKHFIYRKILLMRRVVARQTHHESPI